MRLQLVCLTFSIEKERCGMWSPYSHPARVADVRTLPLGQGNVLAVHGARDVTITEPQLSSVQPGIYLTGMAD